ncbi:MAG: hypothetical protein ACI4LA_07405 [Emergencia sp.]
MTLINLELFRNDVLNNLMTNPYLSEMYYSNSRGDLHQMELVRRMHLIDDEIDKESGRSDSGQSVRLIRLQKELEELNHAIYSLKPFRF